MTYEQIIASWNAQADHMNQWEALGEDEKVEWAYQQGMERAAEICEALQDIPATEPRHCAEDIRIEAHAKNQPESTHDTGNV